MEGKSEGLLPVASLRVQLQTDLSLEEEQHSIHDPHDEMRRLLQLPHCGNVSWFDGLWRQKGTFLQNPMSVCVCVYLCECVCMRPAVQPLKLPVLVLQPPVWTLLLFYQLQSRRQ